MSFLTMVSEGNGMEEDLEVVGKRNRIKTSTKVDPQTGEPTTKYRELYIRH